MPQWNLHYRRNKLASNNFKPTIRYNLFAEEDLPKEEYHPPIEEYGEIRDDYKEDVVIVDDEDRINESALLLEGFMKQLKKIRSIRKLELWISKNRIPIKDLEATDLGELLDYINNKYYSEKK